MTPTPEESGPRLRVAAHNGAPEWGGAEIALCRLLSGLRDRGHLVRLYCNRPVVAEPAREDFGLEVRILRLGGDGALHHALRLARELRRFEPDAFVVGTFRKLFLAGLGARLAGVSTVVARIGLSTDTPRNAKYRLVLRRWVHDIVLNAHDLEEAYREALPDFPADRLHVIHKGFEPLESEGLPGRIRSQLGIPEGARVVGAVARLVEQKRLDRFLRVLARLPDHVHAVIAGDGPLEDELRGLARELGVHERCHFLGFRDDVGDVLESLDLLLLTSDRESLANAMLEALAAGVPVVSTPVSGAREALAPDAGGRGLGVVATFEESDIAAAVTGLLGDSERLASMGKMARRRGRERFAPSRMLDLWEAVLRGAGAS